MSNLAWVATLILGAAALSIGPAEAAPATSPPDFAPNPSVGWVALAPTFIAPTSGPGPLRDDPAHPRVSNDDLRATGAQPTFPMGDANSPILLPWARDAIRKRNELVLSGKPAFPAQASCWPAGVPRFLLYPVQPVYFVQTPKEIVMTWQADHQIRHVYLTDKHSPNLKPTWYGESIGHYEGDTLVVDTVGLNDRTTIDGYETPHTTQLHTVERFRMINGGKTLQVDLHVEDPGTFTTPWNAIQRYRRVEPAVAKNPDPLNPLSSTSEEGPMLEASCAENPNSLMGMATIPVPHADKPEF
jgi:hypothetical protein